MNILTLTIKKEFYDAIFRGQKTSEFRAFSNFYKSKLSKNPKYLRLHYYTKHSLIVEIIEIKIIKKNEYLKSLSFLGSSPLCFEIKLGNVVN